MLGLRATFFIIDVLVQLFSLLKYGVGMVLVFIGLKLIASKMYHIPPSVVCAVLVCSIGGSMIASVVKDKLEKRFAGKGDLDVLDFAAKVNEKVNENTPLKHGSPAIPNKVYTPA